MSTGIDNSIEIRAATFGDAGLLAKLGRATFVQAFQGLIDDGNLLAFAYRRFGVQQQEDELSQTGTRVFIASHDERAVGYAKVCESIPPACIRSERTIELERLYLYPEWHGRGLGKALLEICIAETRRRAHTGMWLDVWDQNAGAQVFYRKHLFRLVGERQYIVGEAVQRHFLMYRELDSVRPVV